MNSSTDPCDVIARALTTYADHAPTGETLLADVRHRLRRRHRARAAGTGVLACTAVAASMTGVGVLRDGPVPVAKPTVPSSAPSDGAVFRSADGWHWESYDTVQVQVPDSWTDTFYSHLWTCPPITYAHPSYAVPKTAQVGRPVRSAVTLQDCGPVPAPAGRVPHLWFGEVGRSPGVYRYDHGWLEEVRVVDGVHLSAFGNDHALLRRILDSARAIDGKDAYGCSPTAPGVVTDGLRPAGPGLDGIGEVESVRICGYSIDGLPQDAELLAGAAISGRAARQLVGGLRAAPAGSGPNDSDNCGTPFRDDLLVTVRGSTGEQEVSVRYNSCNHNGIDDGVTTRQLTREALLPLVRTLYSPQLRPMILERLPR
ncbi:hypothetical protein [Kribbella italica]|uniref:Uncharacterized protein n=1 Tax=Kribbella italica TaxID=1540520 RepID=A0A7W9MYI6_9ACTN|nr:hypothetical protein [Kribbella italica]MBB5840437.1 hypothetical protein [Kribbella italica]